MADSGFDYLAASAHASGKDPIDWAVLIVGNLLTARATCTGRAERGLPPLPCWPDTSDAAVARKVVGFLLDAGWTPPSTEPGASS
ncbi:MAG: hypothetical protein EPO40_02875 [Myxococcaceae bacterium]|nr:MAG: hypothetical protein EPO40_02875 [Myxococcaceae bacterium]